ncbi:MAG TPA: HAD-IIIA family hydrolase [Tepidisphaeraceae bacterium]|nr:HAD-IIIA family hydrolase [Tepidisphaeraceae bacterium]
MKRAAVFFDRDNTLIANDGYLGDPGGVILVEGAADAVARVRGMGFVAITFSNQSGVARGLFAEEAVHAVNARLDELLQEEDRAAVIGRHEFCPFHPDGIVEKYKIDSDLRKPRPGMILQSADRLDLDLTRSWVIGDAPRDIEAGKAAGCRTILFSDPKLPTSSAAAETSHATPDFMVASLEAAVDIIVNETLGPLDIHIPADPPAPAPPSDDPAPPTTVVAPEDASVPADSASETSSSGSADAMAPGKKEVEPPAAKSKVPKQSRSSPKITFAERVKTGAFVPAGKQSNAAAESRGERESPSAAVSPRAAKSSVPGKALAPARPRKPTFAERVRAGTFVPAGAAQTPSVVEAPSAVEDIAPPAPTAALIESPPPPTDAIADPSDSSGSSVETSSEAPATAPPVADEPAESESPTAPPAPMAQPSVESTSFAETAIEGTNEPPPAAPEFAVDAPVEHSAAAPTPVESVAEHSATAPTPVESATEPPAAAPSPIESVAELSVAAPMPIGSVAEHSAVAPMPAESPPVALTPVVASAVAAPPVAAAPVEAPLNPSIVAPISPVEKKSQTTATKPPALTKMKNSPPSAATPPEAPAVAPSPPVRKMTFAERVKAGTFQAERAASTGVAAAAPERGRRVMPMPGDKPQTQVDRVVESLTAVRPTQPITPEEQLEPILQSILEELRLTREGAPESDFSPAKLIGGIVQVLVLPALFFAYLHRDVAADLQSMLLLATFLQTLVIALLLMGRSK